MPSVSKEIGTIFVILANNLRFANLRKKGFYRIPFKTNTTHRSRIFEKFKIMKSLIKIFLSSALIFPMLLSAQNTKKWYADDIYYDSNEKDVAYIQIFTDEEILIDEDSTDFSNSRMSYSMRINRFHRDYYGSALSFNYGYFHNPYSFYPGMGGYFMNDPFYFNSFGFGWDMGWYNPYYNWGFANYGFGFNYNPWYSPWFNNFYTWNNPYGFGYMNPYWCNSWNLVSETNTYYGPRRHSNANNTSTSRTLRNSTSNVSNTINQTPIIRSIVKSTRESIARSENNIQKQIKSTGSNKEYRSSQKRNSSITPKQSKRSNNYNRSSYNRSNINHSPARNSRPSRPSSSPRRRPR